MRHYEKRTHTSTYNELVSRTCDLCGHGAKDPRSENDWTGESFVVDDTEVKVTVRQREGREYPEGGSGTEIEVDLCPKCFKERLIPWLRSQGARIEEKEWDW